MLKKILAFLVPAVTAVTAGGIYHSVNSGSGTDDVKTDVKVTVNEKVKTDVKVSTGSSKKASGSISKEADGAVNGICFDSVGNVTVMGCEGDAAGCELRYEIQGPSQEQCDLISSNLEVECSVDEGVLSIAYYFGGKRIDRYLSDICEGYNLSADLTVTVPETVNDLDICSSLGNLTLKELSGVFSVTTAQGNITLDSLSLSEGSSFRTQLGNITAGSVVLNGSGELSTAQGNISITSDSLVFKDGALRSKDEPAFELTAATGLGNIRFNNTKI